MAHGRATARQEDGSEGGVAGDVEPINANMAMKTFLSRFDSSPVLCFLVLAVLSALFLFIASPYTSPSNPCCMGDAAVYFVMGKGLVHGLIPYRDLFDHKGLLLYFIYAAGELLAPGKAGVFALQVVNFTVILWAAYRTCRLFLNPVPSCGCLLMSLFFIAGCMVGGGLVEEWSLSWSMVALYLVVRHLSLPSSASSLSGWVWAFLGVSLGVHFLLKVTNAPTVCGLLLAVVSMTLYERRYRALGRGLLLVCLGAGAVLLPCLAFLLCTDSFDDFIHSYLEFNSAYAMNGAAQKGASEVVNMLMNLSTLPVLVLAGLYLVKRGALRLRVLLCVLAVAGSTAVFLIPGNNYHNYYMNAMPTLVCVLLTGAKVLSLCAHKKLVGTGFAAVLLMNIHFLAASVNFLLVGLCVWLVPYSPAIIQQPWYSGKAFREIYEKSGRGSLMCYGPPSSLYLYMGLLPGYKYFFIPPSLSVIDPEMERTIDNYFEGASAPEWVVIPHAGRDEREEIAALPGHKARIYLAERCKRVACGPEIRSRVGRGQGGDVFSLYRRVR